MSKELQMNRDVLEVLESCPEFVRKLYPEIPKKMEQAKESLRATIKELEEKE